MVLVAVAGRSNGLGPVLSGNTPFPVINCPPENSQDITQDVWSSLKVPSGNESFTNLFDTLTFTYNLARAFKLHCILENKGNLIEFIIVTK